MLDVMRWGLALCVVMALATTASAGGTFEIGFGGGTVTTLVDGKNETAAAGSSPTIAALASSSRTSTSRCRGR